MQYALKVFQSEERREFRCFEIDGEPWFVLADVCRELDIKNVSDAASRLDEDEKGIAQTDTLGGRQNVRIINESGLYSLILRSDKPAAKKFKKWVTSEVLPSIRKTGGYSISQTPAFIKRFNENWDRIDQDHFSVISELVVRIWARLEMVGYIMPNRSLDGKELRPDVSVGRLFAEWLRVNHPSVTPAISYYPHKTPEWEGAARQYPNSMVHLFWEFVDKVWIPQHAERYFSERAPDALPYLPKLLPSPSSPKPGMMRQATRRRFGQ